MVAMPNRVNAIPRRDHWRPLRIAWRLPQVLAHVLVALPLMALVVNALGARITLGGLRWDHRVIRWWSARTARLFGIRIKAIGTAVPGGVMFVANHINWLDIVLLHSQHMMGFVAKAEIAHWPLVGWLATRAETIYHARGSADSLNGVMHQMAERLMAGRAVAAFPEGRTNAGAAVGTFHARIFQPAISAAALVQPVALRYGERGTAQTVIAFTATENFMSNLMRLIGEPTCVAEVHFLEPVAPSAGGRRQLAQLCRSRIEAAMRS